VNTRHALTLICTAALLAAVSLAGCSTPVLEDGAGSADAPAEETGPITATGFIEAEEVNVVAETGGRVEQVLVDEGDTVTAGQLVVALDDTLLQADRLQAVAAVAVAEANLLQVQEGPRQEEIAAAQAAVDEAQAALQGAKNLSGQAWTTVANPRDIDVQIAAARLEIDQYRAQVDDLEALLAEKQTEMDIIWHEDPQDETRIEFLRYEMELLRAQIAAAQAQVNGAFSKLNLLQLQRQRPLSLIAQARGALAQIPVGEARVELAKAAYDVLVAPARPEEIAIAQAQVDLAEAQVALIDAQIARLALVAPIDGVVTARSIAVGETAAAGVPLLTIADTSTLKLVVYIPETQIGRVRLGAPVEIAVDAYPGRTFGGQVVAIGREAEFTPRNVQTEEERVNLVFAVEIVIGNADGRLKPGMPADATIETAD
jgi:HlyD family secretion protein